MQGKRLFDNIFVFALLFCLAGCGPQPEKGDNVPSSLSTAIPASSETAMQEGEKMQRIEIHTESQTFMGTLYENETARAFAKLLPLQVDMQELNSNEKYTYLQQPLPSDAKRVSSIQTGDLMLFGSDCVVLFYQDFKTSYRYTQIGFVDDPGGLAQALGDGTASVTFQLVP